MFAGAADPPTTQRRAARHSIVAMMAPAEEQSSPPAAAPARFTLQHILNVGDWNFQVHQVCRVDKSLAAR